MGSRLNPRERWPAALVVAGSIGSAVVFWQFAQRPEGSQPKSPLYFAALALAIAFAVPALVAVVRPAYLVSRGEKKIR